MTDGHDARNTRERAGSGKQRERSLREKVEEKGRKLEALRERAEKKDLEIHALRSKLARAQSSPDAADSGRHGTPVFFIVGQPKSGTSWLMWTLGAHPEILCTGEGHIFGRAFKREDIKKMESSRVQPSSLYRAILDAEYLNAWVERSVWTREGDTEEHLAGLTGVAADYFLTKKLAESDKSIVGDKTPFMSSEILAEIGKIYPTARVIHIVRDGRDVAVSWVHHVWNNAKQEGGVQEAPVEQLAKREAYRADPDRFAKSGASIFADGQLADTAADWVRRVRRAKEDGPKLLGGSYVEVRYEDLLDRPVEELRRLLRFLGADASEGAIDYCIERASFAKLSKGRRSGEEDSSSPIRKGIAGDWKTVFTEDDKRVFKKVAGDLLIELGYEKDLDW